MHTDPQHDNAIDDAQQPGRRRRGRLRGTVTAIGTAIAVVTAAVTAVAVAPDGDAASVGASPEAPLPPAASVFVPISPYRTYDSRTDPDESGKIFLQEQRFVEADIDIDGTQRIPAEATAVTFNITVTETASAGFVQVFTANQGLGSTSTVNWTGEGQTDSNAGHIQLFEGTLDNQFGFHVGGAGGAGTHVVIDITGYYVPAP